MVSIDHLCFMKKTIQNVLFVEQQKHKNGVKETANNAIIAAIVFTTLSGQIKVFLYTINLYGFGSG